MSDGEWLTGAEAARLYGEHLRHLRAKPSAAERECEQLRSLLRQVWLAVTESQIPAGQAGPICNLIDASGLLDPWDALVDVDPFTGQPDQHEHGDSCENERCSG